MSILVNRRRSASVKNPYITDGLIAMFDAEWNVGVGKHEERPDKWIDLAGNIVLNEVPSRFESNYVIPDKFLTFESQAILDAINRDELTVEMIIKPLRHGDNNNNMYIRLGSTRGFWLWDNRSAVFSSVSYRESSSGYNSIDMAWNTYGNILSKLFLSGNNIYIYSNGELRFSKEFSTSAIVTGTHIFGNGTSNFELYCIRFYNKVLSQTEITHNALIDKERFGLEL